MAAENVEIVRRLMEAWHRHDDETALSFYADDAVFEPWEGFAEWFDDDWSEVDALIDAGDRVVQLCHGGGRGRVSGVPVAGATALVYTFRDGEIVLVRGFRDSAAAAEGVVAAWQSGDREAFLARLHPDVEWSSAIRREVEGADFV